MGLFPKTPAQPLSYGVYLGSVLGLCIAGFLLSIYLAVSHYRVHTDVGFQSFCALSKAFNCDTVSQSAILCSGESARRRLGSGWILFSAPGSLFYGVAGG